MSKRRPQEPERTCVGCRAVAPQAALIRVVLSEGVAVVDARAAPGRGAWFHPTRACAHNAARGGLARSFRRAVDGSPVLAWISDPRNPREHSTLATETQKS